MRRGLTFTGQLTLGYTHGRTSVISYYFYMVKLSQLTLYVQQQLGPTYDVSVVSFSSVKNSGTKISPSEFGRRRTL
jgi:hypothetical protein